MTKLPSHYNHQRCYWAHMITLRCSAGCPFCILNGRGRRVSQKEMSGKEILEWWNGVEHEHGQKLSIIGGEPTLHPDIVEIINGLKNYNITMTTNCKSPFYKDPDFDKRFKVHPTSTLRINTTFHPNHITADEYLAVIAKWRKGSYFVDQTSFVYAPGVMEQYGNEIKKVSANISMTEGSFLGFHDDANGFNAPFDQGNLMPDENYHDLKRVGERCGLTDLAAYRHICGQATGKEAQCFHPRRSLIIGPNGDYYHCHYKMYYNIGPVCNVKNFKPVPDKAVTCRHYGLCNWCDVPRVGCVKNKTAKPQVLTKLYDKRERELPEIESLFADIKLFGIEHSLECNELKWFEYAYSLLYSGHRIRGKTLDVGSARSVFPYYLSHRGYNVTTIDVSDGSYRDETGDKFGVKSIIGDLREFDQDLEGQFDLITNLSVIEHIDEDTKAIQNLARYLKPGGVMVISTDFYDKYIEYPDANRTIVLDRPVGSHTDSRVYTPETFEERILKPLKQMGVVRVGDTDFSNVDIANRKERSVRGLYTFGISVVRRQA